MVFEYFDYDGNMQENSKSKLQELRDLLAREDGALVASIGKNKQVKVEGEDKAALLCALNELIKRSVPKVVEYSYSSQQAADYLGVSRPTLIKLAVAHGLPTKYVGRHRRYRFEDIYNLEEVTPASRGYALRQVRKELELEGGYELELQRLAGKAD